MVATRHLDENRGLAGPYFAASALALWLMGIVYNARRFGIEPPSSGVHGSDSVIAFDGKMQ